MLSILAALCVTAAPVSVDVSARVLAAETAKPITGATVHVWDSTFATDGVAYDPDGVPRIWNPVTGPTDSNGEAHFAVPRSLGAGSGGKFLAVAVTADGFAPFFGDFEISKGRVSVGDVKLERGADVTVTLMCGQAPCSEAMSVQLSVETPGQRADVRNSSTGKDGIARFKNLRGGKAHLRANSHWNAPGERRAERDFDVPAGKLTELKVEAKRTGDDLELSGMVLDPLAKNGMRVWAQCGSAFRAAELSRDGAFVIRDLPKGECVVNASEDLAYLPPEMIRSVQVKAQAGARDLALVLPLKAAR